MIGRLAHEESSHSRELSGAQSHSDLDAPAGLLVEAITAVRKHALIAIALTACATLGALAFALSQTKIYRATTTIQIDPRPPRPLGQSVETVSEMGSGSWWSVQEYYNTQNKIIGSKRIAEIVVRDLGLTRDAAFLANTLERPKGPFTPPTPESAALTLRSRMSVVQVKESRLFEITLDDADRARASRILTAVVNAYMNNNLDTAAESTTSAVDWLSDQLEALRKELSESELALHQFKLDKRITSVNLDDQTSTLQSEIRQIVEARANVRADIQRASARLSEIRGVAPEDPTSIPESELMKSNQMGPLQNEYQRVLREKNALIGLGKGENHPQVQAYSAQLEILVRAIQKEVTNIQSGAERDLAALRHQENGLSGLLGQAEKKALDLNLLQIEYARLSRTKDNNEKLYGLVLERTKEAGLTKMLRVNNIQVVDPPATSQAPVQPRVALILVIGGLMGLGLGFLGAFLRERLDQTVKTSADMESRFGLVALGSIPTAGEPAASGGKRGRRIDDDKIHISVATDPRSAIAEEVRAIRTNLLFMSPDRPYRRLLVTSPSPAEGKTTVTACLGATMAQAGHRVLLIDCDMRRPRLHMLFENMGPSSTLSETLIHPATLNVESLRTGIPGLSLLPAGPPPPNPAELLHSTAFRELMDRLGESFDVMLLDTPPLIVTDAAVLSSVVDATILVVRQGKTEYPAVTRALRTLRDVKARLAGAVFNAAARQHRSYGYGYYGYGYGAPGSPPPKQESASES